MYKKIILKRIFHRDKQRILISFTYNAELTTLVKQVGGSTYSDTYKSWYIDDNEETLKEVIHIFRGKAEIDISDLAKAFTGRTNKVNFDKQGSSDGRVNVNTGLNAEQKVESEDEMIPGEATIRKVIGSRHFNAVEFRIDERFGKLAIRFTGYYDKDWIREITSFGAYSYDESNQEFLLPWSVMTGDSLSDYFASRGVEVNVIKSVPTEAIKSARDEMGAEIRSRILGAKALSGLDLMRRYLDEVRYSKRTNDTYLALLELFFKYFHEKDPLEISMEEVSEFVYEFIVNNSYSASYQNQMISAIKRFYRISGRKKIDLQIIERPRRSRPLPKVFSKEEVKRILNSARNTKHKLLLWMIYSCGLRRSEVTNILLADLDRDRSVLHIREGKGRVDRIVPVSSKVWDKLDEYVDGFKPVKYLFEGQSGGRYSVESVYRVFKAALNKAGIRKEVGVHSLRHSYATHLHESGLDIRYIQELLGHKSTRTTEIYTHVSRRNLIQVRSPIEDIDVK